VRSPLKLLSNEAISVYYSPPVKLRPYDGIELNYYLKFTLLRVLSLSVRIRMSVNTVAVETIGILLSPGLSYQTPSHY